MYSLNVRDHFMIAHSFHGEGIRSGAEAPRRDVRGRRHVQASSRLTPNGMVVDMSGSRANSSGRSWQTSTTETST